jgi:hypothetical protein
MLLGDVIARFQDEALVSEMLLSLGDLALVARVAELAAERDVSAGELAMQSVAQFANGASDEEWLTLLGQMSRVADPGAVFLRRALDGFQMSNVRDQRSDAASQTIPDIA